MSKSLSINSSVLAALGSWGIPTVKQALAKPEPFAAWLRTHGDREVVGTTRKSSRCPLAEFVCAVTGHAMVMVCLDSVIWMEDGRVHDTPTEAWAREFLVSIDGTGIRAHTVSAADCLAVLTKIGEEA